MLADCFMLKNVPSWLSVAELMSYINAANAGDFHGDVVAVERLLGMKKLVVRTPCGLTMLKLPAVWETELEMSAEPYARTPAAPRGQTNVLLVQCLMPKTPAPVRGLAVPDMLACLAAMSIDVKEVVRVFSPRVRSRAEHNSCRADPDHGRKMYMFFVEMMSDDVAARYLPCPAGYMLPVVDAVLCPELNAHLHVLQTSAKPFDPARRPLVWDVPERVWRGRTTLAQERDALLAGTIDLLLPTETPEPPAQSETVMCVPALTPLPPQLPANNPYPSVTSPFEEEGKGVPVAEKSVTVSGISITTPLGEDAQPVLVFGKTEQAKPSFGHAANSMPSLG
eukprot:Rhum_TRINITY_DN14182_c1_g1::Rhum_TRINITY_DN14182_c1_g1_i1::g.71584::m.71584